VRATRPDLDHATLLIIDMQEYFREIASSILGPLARLVESAHEKGLPVLYTQHGHRDPEVDGGMLFEWWEDHIIEGTHDWELISVVAPGPEDRIFRKRRYSAFRQTGLEEHLRAQGVTDLIIAGVMTNLCCETTARDAFVRDFRVFFLEDGTATASLDMHRATLQNLAFGFATILSCADLEI
jgi:isochorismate hydrolase